MRKEQRKGLDRQTRASAIQTERLTTLSCRLLDERLQFGARHRFVDDLLPAILIHLRKFTQLVEDGPSLCLRKFRQLVDDLGCTHFTSIIRSPPFVSADLGSWKRGT